ncbi:diflavin flavoprotein [Leptolyngbya iicbica]|uniref:Flavin oxidoreductase n=2 Tax=Cyanophyceae TaxID=3028117 RepID=A0A4Q7E5X3_9CYAN|nr:diflavin flavoprotein [Leptolyngbya sp. LK]RZM77360.1 flavin oxidoreductase [Leptolyngbya sp. LK]
MQPSALNPTPLTTTRPRDVQIAPLGNQTTVLRSRTWERLKFEVEYNLCQGTTANSYVIRGDRTALIDPPGESFTHLYLQELQQFLTGTPLDYIIMGHVNPNRMATLAALVKHHPQVTLVCSRPAAQALRATFPEWGDRLHTICPPEGLLDLGQGHVLQLLPVPTPRWPDGLCTYDLKTQILFSDKLFGAHICQDALFDEDWRKLEVDRRYYFDCLHASQSKQVQTALAQLAPLPLKYIAPGHGPIVRYSLSRLQNDYRQWCQHQTHQTMRVALLYASAYGNTAILADAIAQGLIEAGLAVESINCEQADPVALAKAIETSDGFIMGSPTLGGHAPVQIQTALGTVLSSAAKTKLAGVFGSYGWSGEAIDLIEEKLRDNNYRFGFETIRVRFSPTASVLQTCRDAGIQFAQQLRKQKKRQSPRQSITETQADRTEQAVGRVIGSLCVATTCQGDTHSGALTSWVTQSSFTPPGIMMAIPATPYAQRFLQPDAKFILNVLTEGRTIRRHFAHQPQPGENPFQAIAHYAGSNGCLILEEALAYLECRVQRWMQCGDHWLVYAIVQAGDVLVDDGVTAVQQRTSGSQY